MMLFPLILVTVAVNSALHAQVTCDSTLTDARLTEDLICQSDGPRLAASGIALVVRVFRAANQIRFSRNAARPTSRGVPS